MRQKPYLFLITVCIFSLFLCTNIVFAGVKERLQNKTSPRNIQLRGEAGGKDEKLEIKASLEYAPEQMKAISATRYVIYSTNYRAELEEDIATIKGQANFEVFSKGITKIPLVRSDDVGLIEVSVNRGTSFVVDEGNKYYLMVDKPGKYKLDLEFLIKVKREREGGPGQFNFEVMPAPISEFEFAINETQTEVFVEPAIKVETKEDGNKTVAWAIMPKTNNISVRWTKALPKETITAVKLEPKVYSTIYTLASVGEGLLRCQTSINYSILQSEISGLRLSLPDDVNVLEVYGHDLRDWKISKEQNKQFLDVYFKYGIKGNYNLDLTYERNIGEGLVVAQLPAIRTVGVERTQGYIGIASITNVELAVDSSEHATMIDVKELPSVISVRTVNPILLAFKYLNEEYNIQIEVTRHEGIPVLVAAIDSANYITLNTDEGKILTKAIYQVRNNVKQFLRLELPQGAMLWSASVSDSPAKPAKDKNGNILIPLQKSQLQGESLTKFPVEVVYLQKGPKMDLLGSIKLDLPKADIPTNELYWSVFLPTGFLYYNFGGDAKKIEVVPPVSHVGAVLLEREKAVAKREALEPQYAQQIYEQRAIDEVSRKGILPIKIDVPQQGKIFRFSKLLVTENESTQLSTKYISLFKGWLGNVVVVVSGVVIVFIAILAMIFLRPKAKKAI